MSTLRDNPKVIALLIVAMAVLGSGAAYAFWPTPKPAMPETMEDVKALIDSPSYKALSTEQKRPYIEKVGELMRDSDRGQRRELMGDDASRAAMFEMMRTMMADRAKQFALADEAVREAMVDEAIAFLGNRGGGNRGGGDRPELTEEEKAERRKERESHVEQWVNEGNGQEAALIREYWKAIAQRREETGR